MKLKKILAFGCGLLIIMSTSNALMNKKTNVTSYETIASTTLVFHAGYQGNILAYEVYINATGIDSHQLLGTINDGTVIHHVLSLQSIDYGFYLIFGFAKVGDVTFSPNLTYDFYAWGTLVEGGMIFQPR